MTDEELIKLNEKCKKLKPDVVEFEDIDDANKSLTEAMEKFDITLDEQKAMIDKMNRIPNS